jgi:hypothetical protein
MKRGIISISWLSDNLNFLPHANIKREPFRLPFTHYQE